MNKREDRIPDPAGEETLPARPAAARLTRTDLDRVIRRAAELQSGELGRADEGELSEQEILRIGHEVGLDSGHLRRALGEVKAEALAPELPSDRGPMGRFVGPGRVQASRVVPGRAAEVEELLVQWFRQAESLHPVRRRGGRSLWEPAEGFVPTLQRGLKWRGHRYDLARAKQIELLVIELEEGYALVTITADLRNLRMEQGGGYVMGFGGVGGALGTGLGLVALSLPPVAVVGVAVLGAVGGAAAGVPAGRSNYRREWTRIRLAAEGLLDRLERNELSSPGAARRRPGWPTAG